MKLVLTFLLFFITFISKSQCYELINNRLNSIDDIPYALVERFVIESKSGKQINIKVKNVEYKTKLGFIIKSHNLGDTLDVSLITLNRKVLTQKKITNTDDFLRYEPFRKSDNYFIIIKTKAIIDSTRKPIDGCLGVIILERVKKKTFSKVQKIEWIPQKN